MRDVDHSPTGQSALRDHAEAYSSHAQNPSPAPVDDLLAQFDIPGDDLSAWEATRSGWAGAPHTPDPRASLDHLVAVLDSLTTQLHDVVSSSETDGHHRTAAGLSVHDAIGWVCAAWSTQPRCSSETITDLIVEYDAAPGAWLFHAAGIPPDDMEDVAPDAVAIVELIAAARGAHLPPHP